MCVCVCAYFPSSSSPLWGSSVLQLVLAVMASTRNILFLAAFERMYKYSMRHYIFPLRLVSCLPTAISSSFEHFELRSAFGCESLFLALLGKGEQGV